MTSGRECIKVTPERYAELLEEIRLWPWEERERFMRDLRAGAFMTLEELAGAFNVSWRTVQRQVKAGRIRAVKVGRRWVVSAEEYARLESGGGDEPGR